MKKTILFVLVVLASVLLSYANEDKFFTAMGNCSSYSSKGSSVVDGNNVTSYNQILGWQDGKCVYKETVDFSGVKSCVTCRFSKEHLNELVRVMKAYSTVQEYSGEKLDTSSLDNVKDNPVVKVWNKYLQDSSICKIEIKQ